MRKPRLGIVGTVLPLLSLLLGPFSTSGQEDPAAGSLQGRVLSLPDSLPVSSARVSVSLPNPVGGSGDPAIVLARISTDSRGRFSLAIRPGTFGLSAEAFGYEAASETQVEIRSGEATEVIILLEVSPFRLEEIVVTPSTFGLLSDHVASGQILTRDELAVRPHMGNDIFRTMSQVPGVTAYDHSAVPFIRGARAEETLTVLDGLELHEPYHLKQWDGSFSIVDVETVENVDVTTGGFTTEYGDASAGVVSMRTATPRDPGMRTTVGLDFMSSIIKSEGTFQEGKGGWLVSGRRGFLDLVFEITGIGEDQKLHPSYYDLYGKGEYQVWPGHRVSAHFLHAGDDVHGVEEDSTVYRHRYGSSYAWVNWTGELGEATSVRTLFSLGRVWRDRNGGDPWESGGAPRVEVRDQATYDVLGLRQDWTFKVARDLLLKTGVEARWGRADYEYFRWMETWTPNEDDPAGPDWIHGYDNLRVATRPGGNELGVYLSGRVQPLERLTLEGGLRYDRQSHTDGQQMAPRFNAAYRLGSRTNLRGAWGHYYQSQGLHQLWVADGDLSFYPAQRAEHRVMGLEHAFQDGLTLRVEAYQRLLTDPIPEYRNLEENVEGLQEEGPEDRFLIRAEKGRAEGIEFFARGPQGPRIGWAASYALSRTEERVEGVWAPRPHDQRHAVNLQLSLRPDPRWTLSLGWSYHSPWPFTPQTFDFRQTVSGWGYVQNAFGPLNQERLIPYHRIDFRISGDLPVRRGTLQVYLDVFNATNRENAQSADYSVWLGEEGLVTAQGFHHQLEMMPTVGFRWVF